MSYTFPSLSVGQISADVKPAFDPSLRSQAEDGQVISRRRFTGDKKQFLVKYTSLPAADKALLETMQDAVGIGADTIEWTNEDPNDGNTYTVRLSPEGINFENQDDYRLYTAEFTLIED